MFRVLAVALFCLIPMLRAQPPAIDQNGVVNSASRIPSTLAGGALARGARVRVQGVRLSGSVTFKHGSESFKATIVSASPRVVEAVIPRDAPLGPAEVQVANGDGVSAPFPATIVAANPGLYSKNRLGWGPVQIRNEDVRKGSMENSIEPPVKVLLAATGVGDSGLPDVFVGGKRAKVISARHTESLGDDEISVEIPRSVAEGCFVPIYAQHSGQPPSNFVTIAIRRGGGNCTAPPDFPIPVLSGHRAGMTILSRVSMLPKSGRDSFIADEALAAFVEKNSGPAISPLLLDPPAGTCTVYTGSYQSSFTLPSSISAGLLNDLGERGFDIGAAMTVRRNGQTREIPRTPGATGYYRARLGDSSGALRRQPLFLAPGDYDLIAPGFQTQLTMPEPITWSNRDELAVIDRARDATITWTPARASQVILIVATNVDQFTTATAMMYCIANGKAGRFTIPAVMFANFPKTYDVSGLPLNQLAIAALNRQAPVPVKTPDLDVFFAGGMYVSSRSVGYR